MNKYRVFRKAKDYWTAIHYDINAGSWVCRTAIPIPYKVAIKSIEREVSKGNYEYIIVNEPTKNFDNSLVCCH